MGSTAGAAQGGGSDIYLPELPSAITHANIPILLMVLHQLSGSERWLREPFLPSRARGLDTNDDGGLPVDVQAQIRDAAAEAIAEWALGAAPAEPAPVGEKLTRMLSVCVGEPVPEDYAGLLAQEMGFRPNSEPRSHVDIAQPTEQRRAIVIGAGVSGLLAAHRLRQAGVDCLVLEKNPDVGGTWFNNRYPGAGVDTPSYLYSFSFFERRWSTYFGKRQEVHDYLRDFATKFNLMDLIRFDRQVMSATFDAKSQTWSVVHAGPDGSTETDVAEILVIAVGQLSRPRIPQVTGMDKFTGPMFHSSEWPPGFTASGKRVAVIGTGASAMQIVPAIADAASELFVVQRSPQWIAPNEYVFRGLTDETHWLMEYVPYYRSWYRAMLWWTFGDRVHESLRIDPDWSHPERSVNSTNDAHREFFTQYLDSKLGHNPELRRKSLPAYPPFGKRMLLDNGWFDAIVSDNCYLIDSPLSALTESGFRADNGFEAEVDVVVMATGFQAKDLLGTIEVSGRDGVLLRDLWGEDNPTAYLGMTVPKFPNMFVLYGPNTNLGHGGSYIFLAEAQVHYMLDLLSKCSSHGLGVVEVRQEVHDAYNSTVDEAHKHLIWSHPGMDTWYRNDAGRVVTNSPWTLLEYWKMTREADLDDYRTEPGVNRSADR